MFLYKIAQVFKMKTREKYVTSFFSLIALSVIVYFVIIDYVIQDDKTPGKLHRMEHRDWTVKSETRATKQDKESQSNKTQILESRQFQQNTAKHDDKKKNKQDGTQTVKHIEEATRKNNVTVTIKPTPNNFLNMSKTVINPHDFHYIINNPDMCTKYNVTVIIVVHTATYHFEKRDLIRRTWAAVNSFQGFNYRTAFMLAKTSNKTIQDAIVSENNKYHDIVQEDFIDHYHNMTYKHLMAYKWINSYCNKVKYVVKVDDDVLIDVFHLTKFLKQKIKEKTEQKFLYCRLFKKSVPKRFPGSKWYTSPLEYPEERYPDYCEGYAYITTPDVTKAFFQVSLYLPFYWIDDVHVLGIIRRQTDIQITNFREPDGSSQMVENFSTSRIKRVIFLLARWSHQKKYWPDVWKAAEKYSNET